MSKSIVHLEVSASFFRCRSHRNPSSLPCKWHLGMILAIFVWKERFDATSVQRNNFSVNNRTRVSMMQFLSGIA